MANSIKQNIFDTSPISLTNEQKSICKYLDELSNSLFADLGSSYKFLLSVLPSNLYIGALHLIGDKAHQQNNPDWISQAAHSLREIFYPRSKYIPDSDKMDASIDILGVLQEKAEVILQNDFQDRGEDLGLEGVQKKLIIEQRNLKSIIGAYYGLFTDIAHHAPILTLKNNSVWVKNTGAGNSNSISAKIFIEIVENFEKIIVKLVPSQYQNYNAIDSFLENP